MDDFWNIMMSGSIGSMAAVLVGVTILAFALEGVLDWRASRPLFSRKTLVERVLDFGWLAAIMAVVYLPDVLENWGLPGWTAYLLVVPLVFAAYLVPALSYKAGHQQAPPRVNPNAKPEADASIAEQFSAEELKVNFKLLAVVIAFGVASVGGLMLMIQWINGVSEQANILGLLLLLALCVGLLALMTYAIFGRWPGSLRLNASIVIQRPLAEVWSALELRNTTAWWNPIVQRVQAVPGPGERYKMHYFCDDTCGQCGLPRDPNVSTRSAMIEVRDKRHGERMHLRSWAKGSPSVEGLMAYEDNIRVFEAIGPETTRVTTHNICIKPRMWLALVLKLGDPCGEELRTLKAVLEGKPIATLYTAGAARIQAHRDAEKFCGCALGAPIEGKFIR